MRRWWPSQVKRVVTGSSSRPPWRWWMAMPLRVAYWHHRGREVNTAPRSHWVKGAEELGSVAVSTPANSSSSRIQPRSSPVCRRRPCAGGERRCREGGRTERSPVDSRRNKPGVAAAPPRSRWATWSETGASGGSPACAAGLLMGRGRRESPRLVDPGPYELGERRPSRRHEVGRVPDSGRGGALRAGLVVVDVPAQAHADAAGLVRTAASWRLMPSTRSLAPRMVGQPGGSTPTTCARTGRPPRPGRSVGLGQLAPELPPQLGQPQAHPPVEPRSSNQPDPETRSRSTRCRGGCSPFEAAFTDG